MGPVSLARRSPQRTPRRRAGREGGLRFQALLKAGVKLFSSCAALAFSGHLVDKISDTAGSKGTAKWTVQQAAERGVAIPSITSALDTRSVLNKRQSHA